MSIKFDKRLAELDAYLQMLIEESENLDKKILEVNSGTEHEGLSLIKNNLETLLGSIKHAIVLLQIANVSVRTDDSSSNELVSDNKVLHKQRNISTSGKQARKIDSAKKYNSTKSTSVDQVNYTTTTGLTTRIASNIDHRSNQSGGSTCDTSSSAGDSEIAQTDATSSPQPPARSSRRRSQQQQSRQQSFTNSSADSNITSNNPRQQKQTSSLALKTELNRSGSPTSSVSPSSINAIPQKTSEANRAIFRQSDSIRNSIHESSPSAVELNAHNGSHQADIDNGPTGVTEKSVDIHAVYELEKDDFEDEDDDAFFDAADEQHSHHVQQQQEIIVAQNSIDTLSKNQPSDHRNIIEEQSHHLNIHTDSDTNENTSPVTTTIMSNSINNNNNNIIAEEHIDWDLLYEEENEEDLGSLEGQGSVIKHLLSQIRIGMDLTKVVLPTFILERRSLLEMYADFFAHPDLFSSIPDYPTPEERMIQVVRWYLSAFHAGRKSSVAKKPYNPILGEIFFCHWKLDGGRSTEDDNITNTNKKSTMDSSKKGQEKQSESIDECSNSVESNTSSSSDIEKFSKNLPDNSLLFVAEQVSHHPPVSAFYAENREKHITCCAHIYTKSKYLGLSVGVHNVGQGEIRLSKHNETYVCTFPSAYGRSILTVPWVELGGSVNITCERTGYSAKIEFVTKPFYGGKKHRVIGEILRPNNEPFISIDGEWNGCMYSKSPPNSSEKNVFVDTTKLPVIKKNVRPVSVQESFESRNVWKEVTRSLKLRDVTTATAAKSYIEQRQRDQLKDRTEKGQKWKTRYFEAVEDGWDYTKSLPRS